MSHQYYAAIILATRSSARAVQAIASLSRRIRDVERTGGIADPVLYVQLAAAKQRYAKAQDILACHPLCDADIAARQADYPAPRR